MQPKTMDWRSLLLTFFVILNFYQFRFLLVQFVQIGFSTMIFLFMDLQRYIQETIHSSIVSSSMNRSINLSHYENQCRQHQYTVRIVERQPLIIYIEQFLTADEIQHLMEMT